jgi:hypothetical protein
MTALLEMILPRGIHQDRFQIAVPLTQPIRHGDSMIHIEPATTAADANVSRIAKMDLRLHLILTNTLAAFVGSIAGSSARREPRGAHETHLPNGPKKGETADMSRKTPRFRNFY